MKRSWLVILLVCVFGIPLLAFLVRASIVVYKNWAWQRKADAFEDSLTQPFKDDHFGGKTPEETWTMFLDAMQKKDIDLAVKYFFFYDRESEKQKFLTAIQLGRYDSAYEFYKNGPLVHEDGSYPGHAYYHIKLWIPKAHYFEAYPIIFQQNTYTGVWKLITI